MIPCVDIENKNIKLKNNIKQNQLKLHAISVKDVIWRQGSVGNITITFGYYDGQDSDAVSPNASWSHVGSASNEEVPSMNLGFIDPPLGSFEYKGHVYHPDKTAVRNYYTQENKDTWIPGGTVVHEFCHALGMMHEHQNNLIDRHIKLNKNAVIESYKELGMSEEMAYENVIRTYSNENIYDGTEFDKDSIMLYYLPDNWIEDGYENPTKPNLKLSTKDIEWLQKLYPLNRASCPVLNITFVDKSSPLWKKAWVEKVVIETFTPIIGVKLNFPPLVNKPSAQWKVKITKLYSSIGSCFSRKVDGKKE